MKGRNMSKKKNEAFETPDELKNGNPEEEQNIEAAGEDTPAEETEKEDPVQKAYIIFAVTDTIILLEKIGKYKGFS